MTEKVGTKYRGKLIALEGKDWNKICHFSGLLEKALYIERFGCKISNWNSSNLFSDITGRMGKIEGMSSKMLSMLYASDLARRVDKEIVLCLDAGFFVIANQYLHTAMAIALALGADRPWLSNLYSFAPTPDLTFHVKSRKFSNGDGAIVQERLGFYGFSLDSAVLCENPRLGLNAFESSFDQYFDSLAIENKIKVIQEDPDKNYLSLELQELIKSYELGEGI